MDEELLSLSCCHNHKLRIPSSSRTLTCSTSLLLLPSFSWYPSCLTYQRRQERHQGLRVHRQSGGNSVRRRQLVILQAQPVMGTDEFEHDDDKNDKKKNDAGMMKTTTDQETTTTPFVLRQDGGGGDNPRTTTVELRRPLLPSSSSWSIVNDEEHKEETTDGTSILDKKDKISGNDDKDDNNDDDEEEEAGSSSSSSLLHLELSWCSKRMNQDGIGNDDDDSLYCQDAIRERVLRTPQGQNNIVLTGPATGQVAYSWVFEGTQRQQEDEEEYWQEEEEKESLPRPELVQGNERRRRVLESSLSSEMILSSKTKKQKLGGGGSSSSSSNNKKDKEQISKVESGGIASQSVLLLIKNGDEQLLEIAAKAVQEWISPPIEDDTDKNKNKIRINVLLEPSVAARLEHSYGVTGMKGRIQLFDVSRLQRNNNKMKNNSSRDNSDPGRLGRNHQEQQQQQQVMPNLICTLGGDGLLMHVGMLFQGPSPPILCVAGGSLGFLTSFQVRDDFSIDDFCWMLLHLVVLLG